MPSKNLLRVKIQNPDEIFWEGKAQSFSSVNSAGPFDILPQHANFISYIKDEPVEVVKEDGEVKEFDLDRAVVYAGSNAVSVFTF